MLLRLGTRRLHYDLIGPESGRAVVFAHALAADSGMWAEQMPAVLALGMRVLRIDMRGHGGSDAVAGEYALHDLAGDIVVVMEAVHIADADFVGLSIGAMIGEALAIRHGDKVRSLFLCEAPPVSLKNAKKIWAPRMTAAKAAGSLEPIADATMERWLTPEFKTRHPARWQQIRDTVASTPVDAYCGAVAALSNFDFTSELPRLRAPALVLCGEDDKASSLEENEKLASLIPGGRFVPFARARHLPNVEAPERFNQILTDWLRR